MKMIVVGLRDQPKGHYRDFARRWIETLRKLDGDLEVTGYLTSRTFLFQEFSTLITAGAFFNILCDRRREFGGLLRKLQSLFNGIIRGLQVNMFLRRHRPDIAFYLDVDLLSSPIANLLLRPPKHVKTVTIIHRAPVVPGIRGKIYTRSLGYILQRSDAALVLDPSVKEQIVESHPKVDVTKIEVIRDPCFYETECAMDKATLSEPPRVFAIVGVITPDKGVHIAVSAFATVTKEFPDARLAVAGQISDEAYKEYLYKLRAGNQHITITDKYLERNDYYRLIEEADCVLLPYTSSAGARSSGVLLDALSRNKPVIMSDIPGFARYYEEFGLGEMFTADSIDSLAYVIKNVIKNGFGQRQTEAMAAVKRAHSIEVACAQIGRMLEELENADKNGGVSYA